MYEIRQTPLKLVEQLWEFTVCQGAPRPLLQLAEKISSVFLWATGHRVGFTHGTTRHDAASNGG
jgi:hypothetical protein